MLYFMVQLLRNICKILYVDRYLFAPRQFPFLVDRVFVLKYDKIKWMFHFEAFKSSWLILDEIMIVLIVKGTQFMAQHLKG